MLTPVLPETSGKANALARCAQATDIRWTPLRDIPTHTAADGRRTQQHLHPPHL